MESDSKLATHVSIQRALDIEYGVADGRGE